jgi:hypothetical protein
MKKINLILLLLLANIYVVAQKFETRSLGASSYGTVQAIVVKPGQIASGDELREFIKEDANRGTVYGRTIVFKYSLDVQGTLNDSLAIYYFPTHHINTQAQGTLNLKDVVIHYTGDSRGFTGPPPAPDKIGYVANWYRVKFLMGVNNNKEAAYFSNGQFTFNYNDVSFVSYCSNARLHLQSGAAIKNLSVISTYTDGCTVLLGVKDATDVQEINNLSLYGVKLITSGQGLIGTTRISNLVWERDEWKISSAANRKLNIDLVNPIKPSSFNQYDYTNYGTTPILVKEQFTHDLRVLNSDRAPLENVNVFLYYQPESTKTLEYFQTTDSQGIIPQYYVLKTEANIPRTTWGLVVSDYEHEYYYQERLFNNKVDEDVLLFQDAAISENNIANLASIDTIREAGQIYDLAKAWKIQNANIQTPSLKELLMRYEDGDLKLAKDWSLKVSPNLPQVFSVDKTNKKIELRAKKIAPSTKFEKLVCTNGTIEIDNLNGADIDFPYTDMNRDSYVRIKDVLDNDTVLVNEMDGSQLAKYVGECGIAYQSVADNNAANKDLEIIMNMNGGDKIRTIYRKNGPGFDYVHRMGLDSTIVQDAMFMPTDRDVLISISDSLRTLIDKQVKTPAAQLKDQGILKLIEQIIKGTQKKE